MSKVFFSVSVSLDGYLAPPGMDMEHAGDPTYEDWAAQWGKLQSWIFPQRFFRERLKLGEGGETGIDNQIVEHTFRSTGVSIMGKRMFDLGERMWPQEAPFHTPVFVLTSQVREPWVRPGGTTFYFVNDGIESALRQARAVAGDRDIRIAGGADAIQHYLRAGLVDEFALAISPVMFGGGPRLFAGIGRDVGVEPVETIASPRVTHVRYAVHKPYPRHSIGARPDRTAFCGRSREHRRDARPSSATHAHFRQGAVSRALARIEPQARV